METVRAITGTRLTNLKRMESNFDSASFMARVDSAGVYALLRAAIIKLAMQSLRRLCDSDSTLLTSADTQGHFSGRAEIRSRRQNNSESLLIARVGGGGSC